MPIYMDRHDVPDTITAEHIAQMHQEDLKIQHQFGCRGLTYWFDDKRRTAFCLIEAPDAAAIAKMHNKAHGQVPNSIIEVEASIVESFLGRIGDPEKAKNTGLNIINDAAFRTIMVLDIHGLEHLSPSGAATWNSLFSSFTDALVPVLKSYDGNVVKQTVSSYLISLKSVSHAVHAASDIRKLFKEFSRNIGDEGIILKIAMSAGVPVNGKELIFEDAIKLAERMCELVKGEIIISAGVNELYQSENSRSFREREGIIFLTLSDEKFLTQLMDYISSAWNNTGLKVDDFSRPLGYSKSQLYRKMIFLTGKSPNTFIREYRLKEALKLLSRNAGNISEIAFETGFSSPSYFSKCFQKRYGRMPSDYLPPLNN